MKVNLAVDFEIQAFSGFGINDYDSGVKNCIIYKKGVQPRITQRPSINMSEDSSTIGALNNRGRGIYYWEQNSKLYIVHDNDVYETTQDSVAKGTISSGSERVTMLETIGTPYLIILDAENNEGWYMNTSTTVTQIDTTGSTGYFPTTLVHGGAVLDGYLFVMDKNGVIYNSNVNNPTIFGSTAFITAERDNDKGVYLGKHHDHLVSFNTRTIEFFYDAANTSGSPLSRRQDISYNVGCVSGLSVWEDGDIIYFLGSNPSGQISVYKLEGFQLTVVSTESINSYFTQGLTQEGLKINCSGLSAMGHSTLLITVYTLDTSSEISPKITLSYDTVTGQWGFWETSLNSLTTFPLMAWTKRTGGQNATVSARTGEGIFSNGDIIDINDRLVPIDTLLGSSVYASGVYEAGVYLESEGYGNNIDLLIRTGLQDGDISGWKFQNKEVVVMENTETSQTLTIKHSDEASNNFNSGRTIDTSNTRKEIHQGGRFMKRSYQLEYSGDEQIFIEELELDLSGGL